MNIIFRRVLFWMLSFLFGSNQSYRIRPGDSVLVIEVGKDFIKYFKLTKPKDGKLNERSLKEESGIYLNMKSLLPPPSHHNEKPVLTLL